MKTYPHKNIIEAAQSRGSAAKTKSGAWKYILAHLPGPDIKRNSTKYDHERWAEARKDRTADGRALALGYALNDPNTPGRIINRAYADNYEWDRRREIVPTHDNYGAIYGRQTPRTWDGYKHTFPLPRPFPHFWEAKELISVAERAGVIPESYDSIDFDQKGRAEGEALHHELYDFALDAAIICIRKTEGTRYGVKTLSKSYILIERTVTGIKSTATSLPIAKFAKLPNIEFGQIIARVRGEKGSVKLPPAPGSTWEMAYKALAVDGDIFRSIFSGEEYTIGKTKRERAQAGHNGGYYCYRSIEEALQAAVPGDSKCFSLPRVVVRCEVAGNAEWYGNGKIARTYLRPVEIVASRI